MQSGTIIHQKLNGQPREIDGDWIGEFPTMEEIKETLQNAVKEVDNSLDVQVNRVFGEKKSAGFKIINKLGEKDCKH